MAPKRLIGISLAFIAGACVTAIALKPELRQLLTTDRAHAQLALYAAADWRRVSPSKLNISVFTFGDRNHNGVYDTPDKPLNRIAVRLTRPDGSTRIERSNINGFANFSMQRDGEDADIARIDTLYQFEVLPPPGWTISTQNSIQESSFKAISGSISGLGANSPPAVVGLTPHTRIAGQLESADSSAVISASNASGATQVLTVDSEGRFEASVSPGLWRIRNDSGTLNRQINIDYAPVVLGTAIPRINEPGGDHRTAIVGFDDIKRSAIEKVATGYRGLAWDYLLAVDNQFYKGPGYINGLMSGAMVAYNSSGHPVTISALTPGESFDFVGGYFSVAWHNAEGETLHIRAWRGDQLLAEDRLRLSHLTPTYFQADYQGITRLQFETEHYWQFVVDDLQFALPQ